MEQTCEMEEQNVGIPSVTAPTNKFVGIYGISTNAILP